MEVNLSVIYIIKFSTYQFHEIINPCKVKLIIFCYIKNKQTHPISIICMNNKRTRN